MFLLYLAGYFKCNFVKEPFISTSCLRPTSQLQLLVKQALILWYHKFANIKYHSVKMLRSIVHDARQDSDTMLKKHDTVVIVAAHTMTQ